MKYFLDTEFIEGFRERCIRWPFKWKKEHFIDLISIGIVAEDGRNYYAISNEYNEQEASDWVKENVLKPIWQDALNYSGGITGFEAEYIKPKDQIAKEVTEFCKPGYGGIDEKAPNKLWPGGQIIFRTEPEFYGYYSDYDWVVFCSLFGRMIDLPKGFPMYCKDLKQTFDEKISLAEIRSIGYNAAVKRLKNHPNYPKQTNEHNALSDAHWNQQLFKFLQTL